MSFVQCSVRVACVDGFGCWLTSGWKRSRVMRRGLFRRKCHTNVKNGGAEWMEGRRKPVEVVCVDSAMAARG